MPPGSKIYSMDKLRKWISCLVMLAFVLTTMPSLSHAAMPHDNAVAVGMSDQAAVAPHEDCAGHEAQAPDAQKAADQEAPKSDGKCCDKICKCTNSSCNGAAKIMGQHGNAFTPSAALRTAFAFEEQTLDSGIVSRLKRPPRA